MLKNSDFAANFKFMAGSNFSFSYSSFHSSFLSFFLSPIHTFIHPFIHTYIHPFIHPFIFFLLYLFIFYSFLLLFILPLFIYLFIYHPLIYSSNLSYILITIQDFIHSPIFSLIHWVQESALESITSSWVQRESIYRTRYR